MEQKLSALTALSEFNKKSGEIGLYMSSLMIKNDGNIPFFETYFGMLDYDWLLRVLRGRTHVALQEPSVYRDIDGRNLSLDPEYRKRDFYMMMLHLDGNVGAMKRACATRARYHYYMGDVQMARFYFKIGVKNWKTILYFLTSYVKFIRLWVIKKFRVFG